MAAKDDRMEPSLRPVPLAQKLSGRLRRQRSTRSSVFRFKRQKKSPSPERSPEYKPLEVDLAEVESLRLADGWLETQERRPDHDRDEEERRRQEEQRQQQQQQQQQPPAPPKSTTPIADLFVAKSILTHKTAEQPGRYSSRAYSGSGGLRPFSMFEARPMTAWASPALAPIRPQGTGSGSILDRGRPVEPRRPIDPRFVVADPPKTAEGAAQQDLPPRGDTAAAEQVAAPKRARWEPHPLRYGGGASVRTEKSTMPPPPPPPPKPPGKLNPINRHSMNAVVPSLLSRVAAATAAAQASRNASRDAASMPPPDRIRDWQRSVTSAPRPEASPVDRSASPTPSQAPAPVRTASTRGMLGSRLAWIRELEEKKSVGVNRDLGALKTRSGGVRSKLAMFESKQAPAAMPIACPPPLTRTNSTTSRLSSSVGLESTSSIWGNTTATPRTSVDTFRSAHRASSVMSYYDDSFREKLESVVTGYAIDEEKADTPAKRRVTARFVPLKLEKGGEEPQSYESDASTENAMN